MAIERILLFSPYGIALRDLFFNESLSRYLTENFVVDVMSPFHLTEGEWGIQNTYNTAPETLVQRVADKVNNRAFSTHRMISFKDFYQTTGWSAVFPAVAPKGREFPNYDMWDRWVGRPFGGLISLATKLFPMFYHLSSFLKEHDYSAVFVAHPTDGQCTLLAAAARQQGIRVICPVMGVDNLVSGGPMIMTPDLILLWGPEQMEAFENHHLKFRPVLAQCKAITVGGLSHDHLKNSTSLETFHQAYPDVSRDVPVVTFAAYVETGYPGQPETCQIILDFFSEHLPEGHLVVRVRPGLDEEMWQKFALENSGRVTIQVPEGAFFTKWNYVSEIRRSVEEMDVALYSSTLHRSSLVVTAAFSTVYHDAHAAGTPAISVGIPPTRRAGGSLDKAYQLYSEVLPSIAMLDFVTDRDQLKKYLSQALLLDGKKELLSRSEAVYSLQVGTADGQSGARAAAAIEDFLG